MKKEERPIFEGFMKKTIMFHGEIPHRPIEPKTKTPLARTIIGIGSMASRVELFLQRGFNFL